MTKDPRFVGHSSADVVIASDDGVIVLGNTDARGDGDRAWLASFDAGGGVRWREAYPEGQGSFGRAVVAVPGGFVVAGEVQRSDSEFQALALRVGADGKQLAAAAFGGKGVTGFDGLIALPDGSLVAAGTARWKGWLVGLDDALALRRDQLLDDVQAVSQIARVGDGFAVVAVAETSTSELGVAQAAAFAADGTPRWQRRMPPTGQGELQSLVGLDDGGLVVVGQRQAHDRGKSLLWASKLDASGAVVWDRFLGAPEHEHRGRAVIALPDGGVVVAGHAVRDADLRVLVLARLGADGATIWERRLGGGPMEVVRGLARLPDGGLALVGSTTRGPARSNAWLVRMDAEGNPLWDRIFDGLERIDA